MAPSSTNASCTWAIIASREACAIEVNSAAGSAKSMTSALSELIL